MARHTLKFADVLQLRITIRDRDMLLDQLGTLGMKPDAAADMIDQANAAILAAADYVHEEELGRSVARLNQWIVKSEAADDLKTCLAAQKELNKLLGLYPDDRPAKPEEAQATDTNKPPARPLAGLRLVTNASA